MSGPSPSGGPAESYEDLRRRLGEKGYFERPLDRFLLAGVARSGSFAWRHGLVSLKGSLAAGPLLGLLFALAVVAVNRPRLSRPLDFLLLAFGFSVAFVAVVFVLEFAAGVLLAGLVRLRRRGIAGFEATAARAGFAVSLILSAYLAFWWRKRVRSGGDLLWDVLGLVVLITINGALLRVSSLASLAALIRASDLPEGLPRRRRRSRWALTFTASLLLILGFFLAPRALPPGSPSPFERVSVPGRLVVIAWDGVPPELFASWARGSRGLHAIAAGDPPGAAGAREAGSEAASEPRSVLVPLGSSPDEGSRPSFWVGVATGCGSSEHGVRGVQDERPRGLSSPLGGDLPLGTLLRAFLPGRAVAVSAGVRRAKMAWEILSEREGVGAIGWWATWPASPHGPLEPPFAIVTDRALLAMRPPVDGDYRVTPPPLAQELRRGFDEDVNKVRSESVPFLSEDGTATGERALQGAMIDGYATLVASRLIQDRGIQDVFVYLPGLDIIRADRIEDHAAPLPGAPRSSRWSAGAPGETLPRDRHEDGSGPRTHAGPPSDGERPERATDAAGGMGVVARYARLVEARIEGLRDLLGPHDWLIVISDGGRAGTPEVREEIALSKPPVRDPARIRGWVLISGPGCSPVAEPEIWSPLDLTPTLLDLRGFPASRDMVGEVRLSFLKPEWRRARPRPRIDTYGESPVPSMPWETTRSEEEILLRLRSLGYVN